MTEQEKFYGGLNSFIVGGLLAFFFGLVWFVLWLIFDMGFWITMGIFLLCWFLWSKKK